MLIDTHQTIKDLTESGVPEPQAEAIVQAITTADERVATKADLENLRNATQRDLEEFRTATQSDLEEFRTATRRDFEELRMATQRDFEELRTATQRDLENLREEILKTFWRGLFTAVGLIIAATALLLALFS